jgi:hypothetical protein
MPMNDVTVSNGSDKPQRYVLAGNRARTDGRAGTMHDLEVPTPNKTEVCDLQAILVVVERRGLPVEEACLRTWWNQHHSDE